MTCDLKDEVLQASVLVIRDFFAGHEIEIAIVVFDEPAFIVSEMPGLSKAA
jgi:hypothetical protein